MSAILRATIADKLGRYDEMIVQADRLAANGSLTRQERGVFCDAYRKALDRKRTSRRLLKQIVDRKQRMDKKHAVQITEKYIQRIEEEIVDLCKQCLKALQGVDSSSVELAAFIAREKADMYRYMAEVDKSYKDEASKAYEAAEEKAGSLLGGDPLRLSILLNKAIFHRELLNDSKHAIKIAERALRETAEAQNPREEKLVRALISKNLELWK